MHKFILKSVFSIAAAFAIQANVHADWYVGADSSSAHILPYPGSLSSQDLNVDSLQNYKAEDIEPSVSLFGGFRTNPNFSLQVEYQDQISFGIDDMFSGSSLWIPESSTNEFESSGVFVSGISSYPINDSGVLYMKGGLFNWEVDSEYYELSETYLGQSRGTDVFFGLGASYDLNTRFGISAEWERYQMEESDVDFLSTKFKYKF